jgi:hypothetical protein
MYPGSSIQAEVRVFWLRASGAGLAAGTTGVCDPNLPANTFFSVPIANAPLSHYHTLYFSSLIMKNTAGAAR